MIHLRHPVRTQFLSGPYIIGESLGTGMFVCVCAYSFKRQMESSASFFLP